MTVSILAAAAGVLALWLLLWVLRLRKSLRREQEENCRLRKLLRIGAQAANADLVQLRKLRHDLRQYLILAERAAVPEEGASLRETLNSTPSAGERESWAVATLERYYQERAKSLGFQADLKIALPQVWEDAVPDVCLILNNLLENAIEALQREGGGWLRARSIATAGYFSLVVGNSCTRPLRVIKGRYLSSKSPGRFGIGLETVREVAERYGGQAEFTVRDGEFRASVFLPRPNPRAPEEAAPGEHPSQPLLSSSPRT